jgi:hypothetical protein
MNLQETIKKILREEKLQATPQELIRSLPKELKDILFKQWGAKQNPEWHPEGNTLKHILVVIRRAYHHYPDDPNMIMAALFHDLGKMNTYNINTKTGQPTAYGHEYKSTDYVEEFRDWIETFQGTDVDEIKYIVKNHMKVKPSTWDKMRDNKKEPIMSHPAFDKLMGFTDKLDGGGTHLKESIRTILREETEFSLQFRRRISLFEILMKNNFVTNYPCDFENFTAFMQGIHNEIREYISEGYDQQGEISAWLTYEEGAKYVERYMIDFFKEFYVSQCLQNNSDGVGTHLKESIKTILREETSIGKKMKKQIDRLGLYQFMEITGLSWVKIVSVIGVDFLSYKIMADFIPSALNNVGGFGFGDLNLEPILYNSNDSEVREIFFLGVNGAVVDVWSGYNFETHEGEFRVPYYNLSDDILEQVFDIVMEVYEYYK